MRDMPDSMECYLLDNLGINSTCFQMDVTYYGCMFDCRNSLKLSQKFVTRGLLLIISSKRCMQLSDPSCPPSSHIYEF